MEKLSILFIVIPLISSLIGWVTNFLAVKMIFRPRVPKRIAGITIHGLIPRRKADLARKIGETVEKELISHEDILKAVNSASFHEHILDIMIDKIDGFVQKKLGSNPMIAMMLQGDLADQFREIIRDELRPVIPETIEELSEKIESKIDFKEIVESKINNFDVMKLEGIVYSIARKELKAIELFGGLLGFLVGLIQAGIITATGL